MHVFVDPDHRGTGVGTALLAEPEAERVVAAGGHAVAELHTMIGNAPAIALYERAGWRVTDQIAHSDMGDVAFDEHVLRKDLHD